MARPRALAAAIATVVAVGAVLLLILAATKEKPVSQTLGVTPVYPVAPLAAGAEACQRDLGLAVPLERLRFHVGTFGKPGPGLDVTVRSGNGRTLASGAIPGGWEDDGTPHEVDLAPVGPDRIVSICIRNIGPVRAYVYGDIYTGVRNAVVGIRPTVTPSYTTIDGVRIAGDIALSFRARPPRSTLATVPRMFERAALFRPGFVGEWTFWALLAFVLVGAPIILWRALSVATLSRRAPSGDSTGAGGSTGGSTH